VIFGWGRKASANEAAQKVVQAFLTFMSWEYESADGPVAKQIRSAYGFDILILAAEFRHVLMYLMLRALHQKYHDKADPIIAEFFRLLREKKMGYFEEDSLPAYDKAWRGAIDGLTSRYSPDLGIAMERFRADAQGSVLHDPCYSLGKLACIRAFGEEDAQHIMILAWAQRRTVQYLKIVSDFVNLLDPM